MRQPELLIMNSDQTIYLVTSLSDFIYFNGNTGIYLNMTDIYNISYIKKVAYDPDDKVFYVLANRMQEQ